jgi:hypothetical protein
LTKIPVVIRDALISRFPEAEIRMWTMEKEGDIVIHDIEFVQQDQKFEADIKEDGSIHNCEREIEFEDLPEKVKEAVETHYPGACLVEIPVAPDGDIVEDSD